MAGGGFNFPPEYTPLYKVAEESDYKSWLAGQKDTLEDPAMKNDLSGILNRKNKPWFEIYFFRRKREQVEQERRMK